MIAETLVSRGDTRARLQPLRLRASHFRLRRPVVFFPLSKTATVTRYLRVDFPLVEPWPLIIGFPEAG